MEERKERRKKGDLATHIRIFRSSPAEANMHESAGFHDTPLTHPPLWPERVSMSVPFSFCHM